MKKVFEMIGLMVLICFSFLYTEKISTVIKENDSLLKEIEEIANQYKIDPIDAVVDNDNIIPGINGMEIDIKESYKKMKKIDNFNSNLLVYKEIEPDISVNEVYDKYIVSGNPNKNEVSLVFLVEKEDNINDVLNVLKRYDISVCFYIDGNWFENNNEKIIELIEEGHLIGNLGYNYQYNVSGVSWMNTIVTKIGNQNETYCYTEFDNKDTLDVCKNNRSYTIQPSIIVDNNPLIEIKNKLNNGSIIALKIDSETVRELPLVIEYIEFKGLNIVNLEELISEKIDN